MIRNAVALAIVSFRLHTHDLLHDKVAELARNLPWVLILAPVLKLSSLYLCSNQSGSRARALIEGQAILDVPPSTVDDLRSSFRLDLFVRARQSVGHDLGILLHFPLPLPVHLHLLLTASDVVVHYLVQPGLVATGRVCVEHDAAAF